jgi:hypothetical protein
MQIEVHRTECFYDQSSQKRRTLLCKSDLDFSPVQRKSFAAGFKVNADLCLVRAELQMQLPKPEQIKMSQKLV